MSKDPPRIPRSWPIVLHSAEEVEAVLACDPAVLRRSRATIIIQPLLDNTSTQENI